MWRVQRLLQDLTRMPFVDARPTSGHDGEELDQALRYGELAREMAVEYRRGLEVIRRQEDRIHIPPSYGGRVVGSRNEGLIGYRNLWEEGAGVVGHYLLFQMQGHCRWRRIGLKHSLLVITNHPEQHHSDLARGLHFHFPFLGRLLLRKNTLVRIHQAVIY